MSITAMKWAKPFQLTLAEKAVLNALADIANDNGIAWPSHRTIAEITCASISTIKRAIETLENEGILEVRSRHTPSGRKTSNIYRLNLGMTAEHYHEMKSNGEKPEGLQGWETDWDYWVQKSIQKGEDKKKEVKKQEGVPVHSEPYPQSTVNHTPSSQWANQNYQKEPSELTIKKNKQKKVETNESLVLFSAEKKNDIVLKEKKEVDILSLKPSSIKLSESDFLVEQLLDSWNANCGKLPRVRKTSVAPARLRGLQRLVRHAVGIGVHPVDFIAGVAAVMSRREFLVKNGYGLNTALAGDKYEQYFEAGVSAVESGNVGAVLSEDEFIDLALKERS